MFAKFVVCVLAALCTLQGSEAAQFRTAYVDIGQVIREIIDHIKYIIDEILKQIEGLGKQETYSILGDLKKCWETVKPDVEKLRDDTINGMKKCSEDTQPEVQEIAKKVQAIVVDAKNTVDQIISDIKKLCPPCAIEHGKEFLARFHNTEAEIIEIAKNLSDEDRKCVVSLASVIHDEGVAIKGKFKECMHPQ